MFWRKSQPKADPPRAETKNKLLILLFGLFFLSLFIPLNFSFASGVLVSEDKTYTKSEEPNPGYPDTGNSKLTNGVVGPFNYQNTAWVGWHGASTLTFVIDLETNQLLDHVRFHYLTYVSGWGIIHPATAVISGSTDNLNWDELGSYSAGTDWSTSDEAHWSNDLDAEGTYRYVKFVMTYDTANYLFLSELEVYAVSSVAPASPTSPLQYKSNGTDLIANQGATSETSVKLKASATDADNPEIINLFFESALHGGAFNSPATPTTGTSCASATEWDSCASKIWYVTSASGDYSIAPFTGITAVAGLGNDGYKWQVKACDDDSACSAWVEYNATVPNFTVDSSTPDIVAVDAGASNVDRISLTSGTWFKYSDTGSDDQISFSWTDPASVSDDTFYYELNADSLNTITGDESTTADPYIDNIAISEGTNYFHVRPKNGAGTWGTERKFVIQYDKTAPNISIDSLLESSDYLYVSGNTIYTNNAVAVPGSFTADITASDAVSDMNQVSGETAFGDTPTDNVLPYELVYSVEQSSSSDGTITITATDNAGNTSTADITHVNDLTPPNNVVISSISADSTSQLTVNADTATDIQSGLDASPYWFEETTGGAGGSSSVAWQLGTAFIDDGLSINTQYSYQVKARDRVGNESVYSAISSKYTLANAPSALEKVEKHQTQIVISWQANSNPTGTEYLAENVTEGENSGWTTGFSWASSGLSCDDEYVFRVKTRNGDSEETAYTSQITFDTESCDEEDDHKKKTTMSTVVQAVKKYLGIGEEEKEEPIEEVATVPEETPLAFQGNWNLLPVEDINRFALQGLPSNIELAAAKFPELQATLFSLGVEKATDLTSITSAKLDLPSMNNIADITQGNLIAVSQLSPEEKERIPTEVVFARMAGGLVDINAFLKLNNQGQLQQEFNTIVGKPLHLFIKPDSSVREISGYVVFSSASTEEPANFSSAFPNRMFSFLGNTAFAQNDSFSEKEKLLVLERFQYADPDRDGIYEAEMTSPLAGGKYKIVTNINYEDIKLASKDIEVTTVVDPEGYIYEKIGEGELHIPNVMVSIFWLDSADNQYKLWPAEKFMQQNPQTTDKRGTYSFLVPEGKYYLKVEAPNYLPYEGEKFEVRIGEGIHQNIELKKKYGWFSFENWEHVVLIIVTVALIIVTTLLIYNFYQDKVRSRIIRRR